MIFGNYVKNKLINVISRSHINNNDFKTYWILIVSYVAFFAFYASAY